MDGLAVTRRDDPARGNLKLVGTRAGIGGSRVNGEDLPHPAASCYLHGTGSGSDGSQIRFTISGHFVVDKRTGEVHRNTIISTCRVS